MAASNLFSPSVVLEEKDAVVAEAPASDLLQNPHLCGLVDAGFLNPLRQLLDDSTRTALEEKYLENLAFAFQRVTAATQDAIVALLPPIERMRAALLRLGNHDIAPALRNSPDGSLLHIFGQVQRLWGEMIERLLFTESGGTLLEDVTLLVQHGKLLIEYLLQPVTHRSLDTLLVTVRNAVIGGELVDASALPAVDAIHVWVLKAALGLYRRYLEEAEVQDTMVWLFENLASELEEYEDQLPESVHEPRDVLPHTYALLLPFAEAERRRVQAERVEVAGQALRHRLRARRRLSAPLYILPPSHIAAGPAAFPVPGSAASGLYIPPSRGGRQRRASRVPTVTPQSTSADIRQFLAFQAAQEEAFVSLVGGVRPNPRRPSRKRPAPAGPVVTSSGSAPPPPPFQNCERFAKSCDSETNLAGTGWCRVPPAFWWGPLQPGNKCHDIRELLSFNADRVIDVPGVRRAKTPAYPDGRPLSDDYLRTFVEVARHNNHPVPEEIEIYLLGKRIQQRPRPELFPAGTTPRLRLIERAAYGAVGRFQEQNALAVQERFDAAMRGNERPLAEEEEEE